MLALLYNPHRSFISPSLLNKQLNSEEFFFSIKNICNLPPSWRRALPHERALAPAELHKFIIVSPSPSLSLNLLHPSHQFRLNESSRKPQINEQAIDTFLSFDFELVCFPFNLNLVKVPGIKQEKSICAHLLDPVAVGLQASGFTSSSGAKILLRGLSLGHCSAAAPQPAFCMSSRARGIFESKRLKAKFG